jgi:hypothetical protein
MKVNDSQTVKAAVEDGSERAATKSSADSPIIFAAHFCRLFFRWQLSTEFIGAGDILSYA